MIKNTLLDRVSTFVILLLAVYALVLSVSVVEGRIQDLQEKQLKLQEYNQQISSLTAVSLDPASSSALQARITALQSKSDSFQNQIDEADGTIAFGSGEAWKQTAANHFCNVANYFHGMSSETNLLVIGILSCMIAYASGRMYVNSVVTMHDLGLSALTGIIAILAIKGARTFVSDPTASGVDVTDPYGIALFSAFAGLYTNKFYGYLQNVADRILKDSPKPSSSAIPPAEAANDTEAQQKSLPPEKMTG